MLSVYQDGDDLVITSNSEGPANKGKIYFGEDKKNYYDEQNHAIVTDTSTGLKIGSGTTQKLGFFNATPVVQGANTSDLKDLLIALGLLATGGATPLNLDGGAVTAGDSNILGSTTITEAKNVTLGTTTGSKIGTGADQKLGFWNATPVVQPAAAGQAEVTMGNQDSEISGLTFSSDPSQAECQALRDKCEELADDVRNVVTLLHAIRTALVNTGIIKGAAA